MDPGITALLHRIAGVTSSVRWTPSLVESSLTAPVVTVELEGVGQRPGVLLLTEERIARYWESGGEQFSRYVLVLVAIEGEDVPRWIASERVVAGEVEG